MPVTTQPQSDYEGAKELIAELLQQKAKQYAVPLLDEAGNLTDESYDIRLGVPGQHQPSPKRFLEHLEVLRQQGRVAVPGQPVPDFEVTDPFESQGFLDSIRNVAKLAAERSLTGVAFEAATGKKLVDTEGFRPSKLEDISANVLSFFSPLDLAALIGGGGVGGLAVKTIAKKALQKAIKKGLSEKAARKAVSKSLIQIIPRATGTIGLHTAATDVLTEKLETGELSLETFMEGLAKGGLLGATFGVAGGTAGLLTANLSKPAQFAIGYTAEVAALGTASPFIFEDRAPTLADYQHAAEFIVGIKLVGGAARGAGAAYRKFRGERPAEAEAQVKKEVSDLQDKVKRGDDFNDVITDKLVKVAEALKPKAKPIVEVTKPSKDKFLRAAGPKVVQRKLDKGEAVEMSFERAEKVFGDVVLKGKKPSKVIMAQAKDGGKVLMHETFPVKKGAKRKALNILSVDNIEAFNKAVEVAKERNVPLFISTGEKPALLKNLQERGLIGEIKPGIKFVRVIKEAKPTVEKALTKESFRTQMAKAVPKASKEQIDATMAIIDARAKVAGQITDVYLKQRFPVEAIKVGETTAKQRFAQVRFVGEGKTVITAFQKADIGSMVHELGHVFRRDLTGSELAIAAKWAGAERGKTPTGKEMFRWTRKAEEKFADGFSTYLREGKAPNATLKTVFEKFKTWLTEIYAKIKGQKISPEIRGVFDRLLSGKPVVQEKLFQERDLPRILFQERSSVNRFGGELKKFYDKSTKIMAPLSRASKRVNAIEAKTLIRDISKGRFLEGQYNLNNFKISEDLGFFKLTREQMDTMADRIRSGQEPGYRKLLTDIWNAHVKAGGKGKFRKNYFPDIVIREKWADLTKGLQNLRLRLGDFETLTEDRIRSAINSSPKIVRDNLNHILETGQIETAKKTLSGIKFDINKRALDVLMRTKNFKSITDALKSIEPKKDGEFMMEPFWTKEKKLNLLPEMYETNFAKIFTTYILSSSKKRAELEVFGTDNGRGVKTLARLEKINPEEGKIMREVLSKWTGQYDVEHGLTGTIRTLADGVMGFEVITKIASGFATALNTTQMFIGTSQYTGFWNLVKGAVKAIDPEQRALLREAGIFVNKASAEAFLASVGYEGGGRWAKWATFATKWSGFTGINRINNYLSASAINEALPGMIRTAKGTGRRAVTMRRFLAELGVDYRKTLTKEVNNEAMFHFTRRTQLLKDVANEPLYLTIPALRPFLLFKRFGIQQFFLQKDILTKEVLRGNYMPFVRLAVGGYLGGAAMIWAQGQIKSLLSGEPYYRKDDGFVNEVMENIAIIGMFGVVGDMAAIDKLSGFFSKLKFAVEPVVVSDVYKIYEAFNRWSRDWERYGDVWLATKRNTYHIFDIFGSLPRLAAKRLRTPIQVERSLSLQKGRERKEIIEAILGGNGERAANRTFEWNRHHPENPITMADVNMNSIRRFLERLVETRAGVTGRRQTPEFRKALRVEKRKARVKVRLTRAEQAEFRRKLFLLRKKFNTGL